MPSKKKSERAYSNVCHDCVPVYNPRRVTCLAPLRRFPSTRRFSCCDQCSPAHCGPRGAASRDTHRSASISSPASTAPWCRRIGRTVPRLITDSNRGGDSGRSLFPQTCASNCRDTCSRLYKMALHVLWCADDPSASLPRPPPLKFRTRYRSRWGFGKVGGRGAKNFPCFFFLPFVSLGTRRYLSG